MEYTEEQLNSFDKNTLIQLFLVQQSQLKDIDQKLQMLLEQVAAKVRTEKLHCLSYIKADTGDLSGR